jgi:hypothetical protein
MSDKTVNEWLEMLPDAEAIKSDPPEGWAERHREFVVQLFDDIPDEKLSAMVVDVIGVLQERDLDRAIKTVEVVGEALITIKREEMLKQLNGIGITIITDPEQIKEMFSHKQDES